MGDALRFTQLASILDQDQSLAAVLGRRPHTALLCSAFAARDIQPAG